MRQFGEGSNSSCSPEGQNFLPLLGERKEGRPAEGLKSASITPRNKGDLARKEVLEQFWGGGGVSGDFPFT